MTTAMPALAPVPDDMIARIRRDERRRCLEALRSVAVGPEGLTSRAYREGHGDALFGAELAIEQLPIEVSVPDPIDDLLEELLG